MKSVCGKLSRISTSHQITGEDRADVGWLTSLLWLLVLGANPFGVLRA